MVRVCHMEPLKKTEAYILKVCGFPIKLHVSLKSSWRPKWWEKLKKRSGFSEHTYSFMGATDITCDDFSENWNTLLDALIACTSYTRLAIYHTSWVDKNGKEHKGGFIHGDYKNDYNDSFVYNSKWVRQYKIYR